MKRRPGIICRPRGITLPASMRRPSKALSMLSVTIRWRPNTSGMMQNITLFMDNTFPNDQKDGTGEKSGPLELTRLIYIISVIMILSWIVGFFVYHAGWMIHFLLVLGIVAIILRATEKPLIRKNKKTGAV